MHAQDRIALMLGRLLIEQEVKADELAAARAMIAAKDDEAKRGEKVQAHEPA